MFHFRATDGSWRTVEATTGDGWSGDLTVPTSRQGTGRLTRKPFGRAPTEPVRKGTSLTLPTGARATVH